MVTTDNQSHVPKLVSAKTLTEQFGLTKKGVAELPIRKIRVGRRAIRYRLDDVLKFIADRTVSVR